MHFQFFNKPPWIIFLFAMLLLVRGFVLNQVASANMGYLFGNQAISAAHLDIQKRQAFFASSILWLARADASNATVSLIENEQIVFDAAYDYMVGLEKEFEGITSRQLLANPEFSFGTIGWIQYQSQWHLVKVDSLAQEKDVLMYKHDGQGHATLAQTKMLANNSCYLLAVSGAIISTDDTPAFWMYWETYDEEYKPKGHSLINTVGDQTWQNRYGIFCLPDSKEEYQKVTIAPINIYGKSTVYIDSIHLYELEETDK